MTRIFRITDATGRLVANAGFEAWTAGAPDDWTEFGPFPSVIQSTSFVVEGAYSCRINQPVSVVGDAGLYQDVTDGLIAGVTYYIRVSVYASFSLCKLSCWDGGSFDNEVFSLNNGLGRQELLVRKTATSAGIRIGLVVLGDDDDAYFDLVQIGTAYIEFIEGALDTTFRITNWDQQIADYKDGGVWRNSPIADGRSLVDGYWENVIENVEFNVRGATDQDTPIRQIQDLHRLLQKARSYKKTSWQPDPAYIETKADTETNFRYALIESGRLPQIPDPFSIEFKQLALLDVLLLLEHGHWMALPPGETLNVAISAVETYNGRTLGNVTSSGTRDPKTTDEVYIGNQRKVANITHIYNYDDSTGGYSSNLMDAALPFTLFPSSTAVGDKVIVGISTAVADSGPFCNIVWDIETAAAATAYTLVYKYWNGSSLVAFNPTAHDNTSSFSLTGVGAVHWQQQSANTTGWTARSLNGVTAFWVEIEVTALTGAFTRPIQQNRKPYTISWPYTEIQATAVPGDIPALARALFKEAYDVSDVGTQINHVICGVRSISRGANFTAYLNAADEQNPTGVSVSLNINGGTEAAFGNSNLAPSGRRVLITSAAVSSTWRIQVRWAISSTLANQYVGRYHAYVRAAQISAGTSAYGDFVLALFYSDAVTISSIAAPKNANSPYVITDTFPIATDPPQLVDLGEIVIPYVPIRARHDKGTFYLNLAVKNANAGSGRTLAIYDLILIPVDEWSGSFYDPIEFSSLGFGVSSSPDRYLDIDGAGHPKLGTLAQVLNADDDSIAHPRWVGTKNAKPSIQSNARQRVWFILNANAKDATLGLQSSACSPFLASMINIKQANQYLSMRGNR